VNLSPQEAERFYRIWWPLLGYVNERRRLVSRVIGQVVKGGTLSIQEAAEIRDALWADDSLREAFVSANPARLSREDLEIVASWRYRVAGHFYVLRYLKKHTIFLGESKPPRAYGVLGLVSRIDAMIGPDLPVLVEAVLLPFGDKIIYDGLLTPYRIRFGPGICANLNATYRDIQERQGVTTSLLPPAAPPSIEQVRAEIRTRNGKILNAFRKELLKSGLAVATVERHVGAVRTFADTYLRELDTPRPLLDMTAADLEAYLEGSRLTAKEETSAVGSFRRFVRFLRNTGRSDPATIMGLQELLKAYR
jgi:hypothetical protein